MLSPYRKGLIILDYCMHKGLCGEVALDMGHGFIGVEIMQELFAKAKKEFCAQAEFSAEQLCKATPPSTSLSRRFGTKRALSSSRTV